MGFYRSIINGTPHSMSGGFYSSSWQAAQEENYGYLCNIRFNAKITSLNITNSIPNELNLSDVNHPGSPVFGSGANTNNVNGINISNYETLFLNPNCSSMFSNCQNCTDWSGLNLFNWTYVTNCRLMFNGCSNFNQPVIIGQNVVNCSNMFFNCRQLKQSIVIPESVNGCLYMFAAYYGATNGWGDINNIVPVRNVYFKGTSFRNINVRNMFARMGQINSVLQSNNTRGIRVNVHYNVAIENQLLINNAASFTGVNITWTAMNNGYYNTLANIYLYNNYEG